MNADKIKNLTKKVDKARRKADWANGIDWWY
jgi:hypothetical protein